MSIQRTAMGRSVDMASLVTQNEKTRAVGNMGVNARGDVLDSQNRVVKDNTSRVKAHYDNTVSSSSGKLAVDTGMSFDEIAPSRVEVDASPVQMTEEEKKLDAEWNDDSE